MTRDDYYSIYQANIELLEVEMQQVKKTLQMSIGKKIGWKKMAVQVTK